MGLLVPKRFRGDSRHPILVNVRPTYVFDQVAGRKPTTADLVRELREVPRQDAIRWLCALSKALLSAQGMSTGQQLRWARQIFPTQYVAKLETMIEADGVDAGAIFQRRSVWFVLQFAVLTCDDSTASLANDEVARRLGTACLMANDVIAEVAARPEANVPTDDVAKWMAASLFPYLGCDYTQIDFNLLGRARSLWMVLKDSPRVAREIRAHNIPDFESAFEGHYGIGFAEFVRFHAAIYVRLAGNHLESSLRPLLLDVHNDVIGKAFGEGFTTKALGLMARTPDELCAELLRTRQSWAFDVTPLREHPLLEVEPAKFCCPDISLFVQFGVDGIFHLLERAYKKGRFRTLFGKVFGEYVNQPVIFTSI